MKGEVMSSKKTSQFIALIILIAGIVIAIFVYLQYKSNNSESNPKTKTDGQTSATTSNTNTNSSNPAKKQTESTRSASTAKETLTNFLNIFTTSKDKTGLKDCSTTLFYQSSLISDVISGKTTPPMSAQIIITNSETNDKITYQVKEEYNISKSNNSGINGTYLYELIKKNNKWLINNKTD
jgi:hypothetical protein